MARSNSNKLVVANWKMHMDVGAASRLLHRLVRKVGDVPRGVSVVLAAPASDLYPLSRELQELCLDSSWQLGAQNVHWSDEGAYTGEISAAMLKGLVSYSIVGHSERREYAHETDLQVAHKLAACLRAGITPILCVGENLGERSAKHGRRVVTSQLTACLAELSAEEVAKVVITYEPVWAISSNKLSRVAEPDEVEPMFALIREHCDELYGEGVGSGVRVLYGGSVSPDNVAAFAHLRGCDGVLVGSASLNYEQFAQIIEVVGGGGQATTARQMATI